MKVFHVGNAIAFLWKVNDFTRLQFLFSPILEPLPQSEDIASVTTVSRVKIAEKFQVGNRRTYRLLPLP